MIIVWYPISEESGAAAAEPSDGKGIFSFGLSRNFIPYILEDL